MDLTLRQLEQLFEILKRGKWELDGGEILAVASCMSVVAKVIESKRNENKVQIEQRSPIKAVESKKKSKG